MKTRFASSIRLPLIAGALALVVAGCGSMERRDNDSDRSARMNRDGDRSARMDRDRERDRSFGSAGYAGQSGTPGIPPSIDAYSSSYVPFPVQANERSSVSGRSFYCEQHYNQPGCQSGDYRGNR